MSTRLPNRVDPGMFSSEELEALSAVFARPGPITLIDEHNNRAELPAPLFKVMARLIRLMGEKRTLLLIPEDETFTTQAAADYLGVSRQYLVNLLEDGVIPFHRVGSHRRVQFLDLRAYEQQRDKERRAALDGLMRRIDEAGLYEASHTTEDEG